MANTKQSNKHLQINKANSNMVVIISVAAFVVVFSLVASRALLEKSSYQRRVINAKQKASTTLKQNVKAANSLQVSYKAFVSNPDNIIGGNPSGTGDSDGDNAKITLDALPSQYDFPALTSSLEKILSKNSFKIESIVGTDDEVAQQNSQTATPKPIEMPFTFGVGANLGTTKDLLDILHRSIRPIIVDSIDITGNNSDLKLNITAKTYYQPALNLKIQTEVVK